MKHREATEEKKEGNEDEGDEEKEGIEDELVMASQRDFFDDFEKVTSKEISSTNPEKVVTAFDYNWCILFNWDVSLKHPFQCYVLNMFLTSEIKTPWITGNLGEKSRVKKLTKFSKFPGKTLSLFGKIPKGNYNYCFFHGKL